MTTKKQLKFIHITKNAGTSIENIGRRYGLEWGLRDPVVRSLHDPKCHGWHRFLPYNDTTAKYDWFMVIRDPFSRILSDTIYISSIYKADYSTKELLNLNLQKYIGKMLVNSCEDRFHPEGDHFSRQSDYLTKGLTIHVLKFENLQSEFEALMEKYSLPCILSIHDNASVNPYTYTVKDLSEDSIALIKKVYEKDFTLFGYPLSVV